MLLQSTFRNTALRAAHRSLLMRAPMQRTYSSRTSVELKRISSSLTFWGTLMFSALSWPYIIKWYHDYEYADFKKYD